MGREILFRAKHKEYNQWVEGDLIHEPFGECIQFVKDECRSKIKVDPETVCQYTGLTDKNSRKIFEGDIINDIDYGIMKCIYLHGSFVWYKEDGFKIECMKYVPVIEIIGNIYDNPERLEGMQK